jgi:FixJ family two-component response regulator
MHTPKRILAAIVDDDSSVCKALARLLRAAGIDSQCYASAEEYLESTPAEKPECLILDVQLPGMSGLELQQLLHVTGNEVPIIFITAHGEPETQLQGERNGCFAYLRKTDPGEAVLQAIHRISKLKAGKVQAFEGGAPSTTLVELDVATR